MTNSHVKYFCFAACFGILFGCTDRGTKKTKQIISEQQIKYTNLSIDTVYVQLENSSGAGFSSVSNGEMYFFDEYFCHYYPISIDGKAGNRSIGQGRGPNELPINRPLGVTKTNDQLIAFGSSYDAYLFQDLKNTKMINLKVSPTDNTYNDSKLYTFYVPELILRLQKDKLYVNIYTDAEFFDPIENREKFFKDARILMEITIPDGDTRVIGQYSDYYKENYDKTNHLFGAYYDIDNEGNFHVSFQTDSVIHIYDPDFNEIKLFGFKGKDMNQNYEKITQYSRENIQKMQNDLNNRGYYYWYKYNNENKLSFRSYQKGDHSANDGLQIYDDGILVADVEVPKNFKVEGYMPPYYVTRIICDEESEKMWFYRFKLD